MCAILFVTYEKTISPEVEKNCRQASLLSRKFVCFRSEIERQEFKMGILSELFLRVEFFREKKICSQSWLPRKYII
jgi:hypothetical protein